MRQKYVQTRQSLTGQCVAYLQGLPGSLPEAAEAAQAAEAALVGMTTAATRPEPVST